MIIVASSFSEKLRFKNVFSSHKNEKLRIHDGLLRTVDLIVQIMLCFQSYPV